MERPDPDPMKYITYTPEQEETARKILNARQVERVRMTRSVPRASPIIVQVHSGRKALQDEPCLSRHQPASKRTFAEMNTGDSCDSDEEPLIKGYKRRTMRAVSSSAGLQGNLSAQDNDLPAKANHRSKSGSAADLLQPAPTFEAASTAIERPKRQRTASSRDASAKSSDLTSLSPSINSVEGPPRTISCSSDSESQDESVDLADWQIPLPSSDSSDEDYRDFESSDGSADE